MSVSFHWDSGPLLRAAAESYKVGLEEAAVFARSRAAWKHVAATISPGADGVVVGSPDRGLLEGGSPAHEIEKTPGKVTAFKTGGFATGPIEHPGFAGKPFMRPTEAAWPEIYVGAARRVFPK
jgi:hypothetical protein